MKTYCEECKKEIDLDFSAYYPYAQEEDENGDIEENDLQDTPFCEECANKINKEL